MIKSDSQSQLESAIEESREDQILGGSGPLPTILRLSIGPFFSQVTNSMFGFVNTLWLKKAVSEDATAALATATTIDTLAISFGIFLSTCTSSKIAALFGEKRHHAAAQIISDAVRFSIILGLIIPAVLIPVGPLIMAWFGSNQELVNLGYKYIVPVMSCSAFTCIDLMLCGCLQAEGRTMLFAAVQVSSMILNACVFNPMFLLGFKIGIEGAAASVVLSQAIPGVILFGCYYGGVFTVKPKFKDFLKKPSPEFYDSLKIGVSSLIAAVSDTVPSIVFQKFIGASCGSIDEYRVMMNLYNAYNRIYQIAIALFMAISTGFLSTASYAYGARRYRRVIILLGHATWLTFFISGIIYILMFGFPGPLASLFSSDPLFIKRFKDCTLPYWTTNLLCSTQYIIMPFLQATGRTTQAIICAIVTQLIMWPAASCVFYFTDKHNVVRVFYAAMLNDCCSFTFLAPFAFIAIRNVYLLKDGYQNDGNKDPLMQSLTDSQSVQIM